MTNGRPASFAILTLWATGLVAVGAEEAKPVPAPADPVAVAKAQLDEVKAQKAGALVDTPVQLPITTPTIMPTDLTPEVPADTPLAVRQELAKQRQQKDWLLEALRPPAKPGEATPAGEPLDPTALTSGFTPTVENRWGDLTAATPTPSATPLVERGPGTPVPSDPMRPYLATWMTPQDYTLLMAQAPSSVLARTAEPEPGAVGAMVAGLLPKTDRALPGGGVPTPTTVMAAREPQVNPYLQAMTPLPSPKVAPVPVLPAPPTLPVVNPAPAPSPPRTPPPAPPSRTDDQKYFPQLKRF